MSSDTRVRLAVAELVELAGPDARAFAQAQFSSDVTRLQTGAWQWSAWLDAQGRVRNVFALLRADDERLVAWLPLGAARTMAGELGRYVMRSKLSIGALEDWRLLALTAPMPAPMQVQALDAGWTLALPGATRTLALLPAAATLEADADPHAAHLARLRLEAITAGLPWLDASLSGEFVAPALGLDRLGATSLDKGCYPGQEIVARLHYRGGNKRHCRRLSIATDRVPGPGDTVLAGAIEGARGTILYATRSDDGTVAALAVLPETLTAATGLQLATGAPAQLWPDQAAGAAIA